MINEIGKVNVYDVYRANIAINNAKSSENDIAFDDTATVLELSEEAYGDGVVTVKGKSAPALETTSISNQACHAMLSYLGFYSGPLDGNLTSTASIKALKQFQKVYGLSETGSANTVTLNKINSAYNDYIELYTSDAMDTIAGDLYHQGNQSDTFARVYTFLKNSMGLTTAQIAGVMGNMHAESGINADNANEDYYIGEHNPEYALVYDTDDFIAFGLIQWYDESRKDGLLTMAKEWCGQPNATTITSEIAAALNDVNVQLAYFRKEMTQISPLKESWQQLKNTYTYTGVSDVFLEEIESPNNCNDKYAERRRLSGIIYNALLTL